MEADLQKITISQVFEQFLAEQEARIGHKTFLKYQSIISLYKSYLEGYWPGHDGEYKRITDQGGTFCGTFGPKDIAAGYGEFLGYFMPRKVMCGKETMQAAGTVLKKLAKWLANKGCIEDSDDAQDQAGKAAKDLPKAREVLELLEVHVDETACHSTDVIEDHFWIERIEPGKLWLQPLTASNSILGPIPVPKRVTDLCRPMWDIGGVVAKVGAGWRLVEVWNVSP